MRFTVLLLALPLILGACAPRAKDAPCRIYAYNLSGKPAQVELEKKVVHKGVDSYIYQVTSDFWAEGSLYLPAGTQLSAAYPFLRCKYQVVKLNRLPGRSSWFPAQAVIMPDKRRAYFSMITLPANGDFPKTMQAVGGENGRSDGKQVIRPKTTRR